MRWPHVEVGARWSWTMMVVVVAPAIVLGQDIWRRSGVREEAPPVTPVRTTWLIERERLLPRCTCTGIGDPLCAEIPGQTCALH